MRSVCWIGFFCIVMSGFGLTNASADDALTAEQLRFFETSIRPLLVEKCQSCHGPDKQWGTLRLDSRDAILKGGETGPAIVLGKPDESLIVKAIRRTDDDLKMPPKETLSERQVADLVRWVEMGAPFPSATGQSKPRHRDPDHWSFRPVIQPTVSQTQKTVWASGPWDQFILAKLERAKIVPTDHASPRTLIRRATFDVTGLPPTPDEIVEFLADDRPDAYARLIDRLLASPSYGERWGRHWLDVARYADSNGLDENVAHGNAWRYRDYVVSSLNLDLPYDEFLTEQLAGDLLSASNDETRSRHLIATGFLAIGPKVLAEVDETKMQMDIIDEQIDTVGRAMLGLTLGCARCHDHKFDPIDAADYYGLAGIFKSTRTMEHFKKVARWYENPLPSVEAQSRKASYDSQVAQLKDVIKGVVEKGDALVKLTLPASDAPATSAQLEPKYPDEIKTQLKSLRDELAQLERTAPEMPSAMGATEDAVVDVAIHVRGNPLKLGDVVPRRVPHVLARQSEPKFDARQSGRIELARWLTDPNHPLTSRVFVNRVWRWHFGKGIVRSIDNFGLLGEQPTHPELLDSLARNFMQRGWSIKGLHRQLMESSTYQLDSDLGKDASNQMENDPENRLFGRAELHRLEAEAIRDSLIAVGDSLDRTLGQSLLTVKNRAYFFDHTSKDLTDYRSNRRSIYLPVVRNNVYDVFQLLDYPDAAVPNVDRPTTTIAPQALMMMNSEFVEQCSANFATLLFNDGLRTDDERIERAYLRAYGRQPTTGEVAESKKFLNEVALAFSTSLESPEQQQRQCWNSLCHVIVSSNEFIYVK